MSGAPPSLRRSSRRRPTIDVRRVWERLSAAEQNAIGPLALLLGYAEAAAYRVDGRGAIAFEAARHHAGIILQQALEQIPELRAMLGDFELSPPRPDLSVFGVRQCRRCGCTDAVACPSGCFWVAPDLCSSCAR